LTGWAVFPWIVLVLTAAVGVSVFQTGGLLVATDRQYVDFARLNPAAGIRRIFSLRGLVRTALDSGKVALVGLVAYLFLVSEMPALAAMAGLGFPEMVAYALQRSVLLAYEMTAVILALAFADYLYQRFQYFRDLRMTREEVRQELKDIEGDPQIRIRRRQIQLRIARQRMMERVPEAEVVITNPTELAVALQYDPQDMDAPEVVAKGAGFVAQRIREIARQHHIPIVENPPLAQLLFRKTDVGRSIPEESFVAVAELMAYVYRISGRKLSHLA
jgi:flagellar biosynthetic protein FlhB